MEHQVFRCKTQAIVYLKTHASWMNPRRDRVLKKVLNKKRGTQGSSSLAYMPHCPQSGPSLGRCSPNQQEKLQAEAHSLHPLNNNWTSLCIYLKNGNAACFSPKLAGPSWMFFLTLYQKCNWQPAPRRQCNVTCSFKQPLVSIPSPFSDTIVYFYTLNTFPPPFRRM